MTNYHKNLKWSFQPKEIKKIIKAGKLWEARDICLSLMGHSDYNEELYIMTAEIFYEMKDFPRAGIYWMMTSKNDEIIDDCINWAIKVYGKDLPNRYKMKTRRSQLPAKIEQRVDKYFKNAGIEEGEKALRKHESRFKTEQTKSEKIKSNLFLIGCLIIILWILSGVIYGTVHFIMHVLK